MDGEGEVPGAGVYRASCMLCDSKERPDGGAFQEPWMLGEAPGSDWCSLAVLKDCVEDTVPNEATGFGWGGTEAGQNVGGDEESAWILLVVSSRKLDIIRTPLRGNGRQTAGLRSLRNWSAVCTAC